MNNLIKDYLRFSRKETNGIVALCSVILLVFLTSMLIPWFIPKKKYTKEQAEWNKSVEKYLSAIEEIQQTKTTTVLFSFNPNSIDEKQWIQLGVSESTAKTIRNYLSKGGTFKKKEDLLKIYGFHEDQYILLEPYIHIPNPNRPIKIFSSNEPKNTSGDIKKLPGNNVKLNPFVFDPNTILKEELVEMGLPEKTSATWINFRNKGAVFKNARDIEKIYGLRPEWVNQLIPFISIDSFSLKKTEKEKKLVKDLKPKTNLIRIDETVVIDINTDQTSVWEQIEVIKPSLASRIIKYKKLIGGFHTTDQVLDVYGFPKTHWQVIQLHLVVHSKDVRKLSINNASKFELQKHPYINKLLAYWIVENRKSHPLTSLSILESKMIDPEMYEKLKPYLME